MMTYESELQSGASFSATGNGHEAEAKLLLANDRNDVNARDSNGRTLLLRAAESGHEATVQLLLTNNRVDVNARVSGRRRVYRRWISMISMNTVCGPTPLSLAAENGHEAVVKLLLANDEVDVNAEDFNERTPLSLAAENGHEAVVKLLLANGLVNINAEDSNGQTPLSLAAERGHEAVVKLLLEKGRVGVNARSFAGQTPLSLAAENGHEAVVKLLLANGLVDVNAEDSNERTPLSLAAENGHEVVVKLLLANDQVDVNARDSDRRTPLLWAVENGHQAVVKLLFYHRPNDTHSETPTYLDRVWCIILFLMFQARRLEMMLQFTLSSDRLSEFPNRRRPPCTTMPWNVRPALVVLWGVCWMFYSRPNTPQPNQPQAIWYSEPLDMNPDIPYELNQSQHINIFDQPSDWLQERSESSSQLALSFNPFADSGPLDTWSALLLEENSDLEQVETSNIPAFQASTSSEQISIEPLPWSTNTIPRDLNNYETLFTSQKSGPNNLMQPSMAVMSQHLTQSDLATTLPTTEAADNHTLSNISQTPTHADQSIRPPRDSKGSIICDRVECSGITFRTNSAWRTHTDRHNRPYKCESADCLHTSGFGSRGELTRHTNSVHKRLYLPCPITGCSYSCTRKDNLQDHINRQHKDLIVERPALPQKSRDPPAENQDILNADLSRQASPADQVDMATKKRKRVQGGTLLSENVDSTDEKLHRLEEENKRLRKRVGALERELESSKKREETLFDVVRKCTKE